ncbi:MAG TPA: hypothetical protein VLA42_08490 [Verrucomicrobiae bacterium]|jgi:hypothetical protein|nr:hypothetical protein [Verrucomicrobiae bacterium]
MKVSANFSALKKTKWYEYAVRFLLGGTVTVVAGLLAKYYGPVFGGLFLAFPAIFPASATLVDKHERQKKQRAGIPKTTRGRQAAGLDAAGAAHGSLGLATFAYIIWKLLPAWNVAMVFVVAVSAWLCVPCALWWLRKEHWSHSPK